MAFNRARESDIFLYYFLSFHYISSYQKRPIHYGPVGYSDVWSMICFFLLYCGVGKREIIYWIFSLFCWVIQNSFKLITAAHKWNIVETGIVSVIFGLFHSILQAANSSATCRRPFLPFAPIGPVARCHTCNSNCWLQCRLLVFAAIPLVIGTMLCNRQIDKRYFHPNFLYCWCGKKEMNPTFWFRRSNL